MATQERFITDDHTLERDKAVSLTITIGNDQIGGSQVWFKETPTTILGSGTIINLALGNGNDIVSKVLCIKTNFFDKNPNTNNISAMYNFNNGTPTVHVYFDHVLSEKDFFVFHIEFTLK